MHKKLTVVWEKTIVFEAEFSSKTLFFKQLTYTS